MEEDNRKKVIVPIVIGVLTLLVLVIGATYAYFAVGINNNFGTTTISASADEVGTVTLTNINSTLSMNVTAADMMFKMSCKRKVCENEVCEWVECSGNETGCACGWENVNYYATPSGKSTTENMAWEIGRETVTPNTDTNYYSCDYTLSVSNTGTTNMYTAFTGMPEEANATEARPNAYKSAGQVVFQINDTEYDWYTNGMPNSYTGNMIVSADNPGHITAGLKLVNAGIVDQTDLAGTDIAISIQATSFSCTAVETEIMYYNTNNKSDISSSPGNRLFYVKQKSVNSMVVDNEVCGPFNNEVCIKNNNWANVSDYYDEFVAAGAICNYSDTNSDGNNDRLKCGTNSNSTWCTMFENGKVTCGTERNGACDITPEGNVTC